MILFDLTGNFICWHPMTAPSIWCHQYQFLTLNIFLFAFDIDICWLIRTVRTNTIRRTIAHWSAICSVLNTCQPHKSLTPLRPPVDKCDSVSYFRLLGYNGRYDTVDAVNEAQTGLWMRIVILGDCLGVLFHCQLTLVSRLDQPIDMTERFHFIIPHVSNIYIFLRWEVWMRS